MREGERGREKERERGYLEKDPDAGPASLGWMDNIRRDMRLHCLDESMTEDRKVWSTMVAKVDTR